MSLDSVVEYMPQSERGKAGVRQFVEAVAEHDMFIDLNQIP